MKFKFSRTQRPPEVLESDWQDPWWQLRLGAKTVEQFERFVPLTSEEREAFYKNTDPSNLNRFTIRATPYYLSLINPNDPNDPIRRVAVPQIDEYSSDGDHHPDPLGENKNSPVPRIVHRYPDRVLFLVTDMCSVYCRYCTRKHFTGQNHILPGQAEYKNALTYIRNHPGIREVILSGGDPLTVGDAHLDRILSDLRAIEHVEIIRIGSRMPVVCPMRITDDLVKIISKYHPIFMMVHFNHPREITQESATALLKLVNAGTPVMNQMVLLNGVNNDPAIVQALSRRLLYLRVKPYYMFQCDPSRGTEHLRTSIDESLAIQRELWGRLSGLAMPSYSIDIPDGGGKTGISPDFQTQITSEYRKFVGWDGVHATYHNPSPDLAKKPSDAAHYQKEWDLLCNAKVEIREDLNTDSRDVDADLRAAAPEV